MLPDLNNYEPDAATNLALSFYDADVCLLYRLSRLIMFVDGNGFDSARWDIGLKVNRMT